MSGVIRDLRLPDAASAVARTATLLVATDYDGTLAPLVSRPSLALTDPDSGRCLTAMAALPATHVAVISGRAREDLVRRFPANPEFHLVGSHGVESGEPFDVPLAPGQLELLRRISDSARRLADETPGALAEMKPAGVAFHFRNVEATVAETAVARLLSIAGVMGPLHLRQGKLVVELSVRPANKGMALLQVRQRVRASAAVFVGDDATDEDAFAVMAAGDVSVKVGGGISAASYRVAGVREVSQLLAHMVEARSEWLRRAERLPGT